MSGFLVLERRWGLIRNLATHYSARAHSLLLAWNSLAAVYVGSADFRNAVAGAAHTMRLPLWTLALFTGLINITVSYGNWKKQQ